MRCENGCEPPNARADWSCRWADIRKNSVVRFFRKTRTDYPGFSFMPTPCIEEVLSVTSESFSILFGSCLNERHCVLFM